MLKLRTSVIDQGLVDHGQLMLVTIEFLVRFDRQYPMTNSRVLRHPWRTHTRVLLSTDRRRVEPSVLMGRRPIRRLLLTVQRKEDRQRQISLQSDNLYWRVRWSNESRFPPHDADGGTRAPIQKHDACSGEHSGNISCYGLGVHLVWLYNLNGRRHQDAIFYEIVFPHFDNLILARRPMFMDDNGGPYRARAVRDHLQQKHAICCLISIALGTMRHSGCVVTHVEGETSPV